MNCTHKAPTTPIPTLPAPVLTGALMLVYGQLLTLRRLTKDSGTRTTRSQNKILRSLSDEDLVLVSQALDYHQQRFGW